MVEPKLSERIAIIHRTRDATASALAEVLGRGEKGESERSLCDKWLRTLGISGSVCAEGWYRPPPGGACVLIGQPEDGFTRLNYDSLRTPAFWSSDRLSLRDDSLVYVYASPFDRQTGLIGDIGLTLYRGDNEGIWAHLSACMEVTTRVATFAEIGMELREVFDYAVEQMKTVHLINKTSSTKSGVANIGHTVPWSYGSYPDEVKRCLEGDNSRDIRDLISGGRVSINAEAALAIAPTMAITIEPQIASEAAPLCSYHLIVSFVEGKRIISPSFAQLFKAFAMDHRFGMALARLT
jgi:hypothetical protein